MKYLEVSLQWRRLLVVSILTVVVLLGLLVTLILAQTTLPPDGAAAFIQTSGADTPLEVGDWYTSNNPPGVGGDEPHIFHIFVPCTIADNQVLTVELFDPEIFPGTDAIDEIRPPGWSLGDGLSTNVAYADNAEFVLIAPDGTTEVQRSTYVPASATDGTWVIFATFTTGDFGCGVYELRARTLGDPATTGNNDDNSWKVLITHPDGNPGTGDEPAIAALKTSYQHADDGNQVSCQNFYFFVRQGVSSITLNNFDLDAGGAGYTGQSLTYIQPDGTPFTAPGIPTLSGGTEWNNGTNALRGGDVIDNPQAGWWHAQICVAPGNQYIFEPPSDYILSSPEVPSSTLSLAAEPTCREIGQSQTIPYTIDYINQGVGAAFSPTMTVSLPASTTLASCVGANVTSCVESPAGVVTILLGQVLAAGVSGQVALTVELEASAPSAPLTLTSTAEFAYEDAFGNVYPPFSTTYDFLLSEICPLDINLSLTKSTDVSCHTAGRSQTVNYTINYGNAGTDDAFSPTITDTLPVSTTYESGSCGGASVISCDETAPGSGVVVYSLDNLAAGTLGRSVGLTAQVDVAAPGQLTNLAELGAVDISDNAVGTAPYTHILQPCSTSEPGGDRDNDNDNDRDPTATPVPAPSVAQATPPPAELPVIFLPETGLRDELWFNNWIIAGITLLLTLSGTTVTLLYLRSKRKK